VEVNFGPCLADAAFSNVPNGRKSFSAARVERSSEGFMQITEPAGVGVFHEDEYVWDRAIRVDGVELCGRLLNMSRDPIERRIVSRSADDLKSGCTIQLLVKTIVARGLHFTKGNNFPVTQYLEVGGTPCKRVRAIVPL